MNRQERRAARGGRSTAAEAFAAGLAEHQAGRPARAIPFYREASRLAPAEPEIWHNLGMAFYQAGQAAEALEALRQAVALRPGYLRALNNLGILLAETGALAEAEDVLTDALRAGGEVVETINNLAVVRRDRDADPESVAGLFRRALTQAPAYADALANLGIALLDARQVARAVRLFRRALAVDPHHPRAHFNLGLALLLQGRFEEGWREHEWRWRGGARNLAPRSLQKPAWQGEALAGRTILLWCEQGYGDAIQFIRFAPLLAAEGARVVVECPPALVRLFSTVPGIVQLVPTGGRLPRFDCHLPLMSVPRFRVPDLAALPAGGPYLMADRQAAAAWAGKLPPGFRVGLVWAGDPRRHDPRANAIDRRRSLPLAAFAPLLSIPGISWVSLQMGEAAAEQRNPPAGAGLIDAMGNVKDFADTAAIVAALDLVITADTAVAHLAGALERPVWIASRFDGCWRWLETGEDSPWYPTARLFRQPAPGRWSPVIEAMAAALAARRPVSVAL